MSESENDLSRDLFLFNSKQKRKIFCQLHNKHLSLLQNWYQSSRESGQLPPQKLGTKFVSGAPSVFFCSFEVPLTSFKLFLISRIRNLFGTAAKKYSIVSLPPPKRKKRYRAAFEFDKNTFNTQGLWFFSLSYPDSHAYTFLCKVNKGTGQHKIKLYQFVRRVN